MTSRTGDIATDGFTLLELLVVLTVMGLLLSVATPFVGRGMSSVTADTTIRELAADLRMLRRAAMENRRDKSLFVDLTGLQYTTSLDDRVRRFPEGFKVSAGTAWSSNTVDRIEFRFFGDGSANGGWIALDGQTRTYRVEIEWLSGRVAIHG